MKASIGEYERLMSEGEREGNTLMTDTEETFSGANWQRQIGKQKLEIRLFDSR